MLLNPHRAGLASLHRNEGGFLVAEIHYRKTNMSVLNKLMYLQYSVTLTCVDYLAGT